MEPIQQLVGAWWAAADSSTHMAVIVFGSTLLLLLVFMIIGANTNPLRRPHNEAGFREFARVSLAANEPVLRESAPAEAAEAEAEAAEEIEEPAPVGRSFKVRRF